MDPDSLLVSLSPERLPVAQRFDAGVELKFDWEHREILRGDRDLEAVIADQGVPPDRIRSVHLPPGTTDAAGMTVTGANRGSILTFVHEQAGAVPDAHLTGHPPKRFDYAEYFGFLTELLDSIAHPVTLENLPDECPLRTAADIAYFAHAGRATDRLDDLYLTVDSAHFARQDPPTSSVRTIPETQWDRLREGVATDGRELPPEFRRRSERRLADNADEYLPGRADGDGSRWTPFARSVFVAADRTRSVHLNDPATDRPPLLGNHTLDPVLGGALDCVLDNGGCVVLEPGSLPPSDVRNRVAALHERF